MWHGSAGNCLAFYFDTWPLATKCRPSACPLLGVRLTKTQQHQNRR
jgi:hypothetical protein